MVMQTSCKKDMEQMDLLQAFEIIVDKAKNSSLGRSSMRRLIHILDLSPINWTYPSVPVPSWPCLLTDAMTVTSSSRT